MSIFVCSMYIYLHFGIGAFPYNLHIEIVSIFRAIFNFVHLRATRVFCFRKVEWHWRLISVIVTVKYLQSDKHSNLSQSTYR